MPTIYFSVSTMFQPNLAVQLLCICQKLKHKYSIIWNEIQRNNVASRNECIGYPIITCVLKPANE